MLVPFLPGTFLLPWAHFFSRLLELYLDILISWYVWYILFTLLTSHFHISIFKNVDGENNNNVVRFIIFRRLQVSKATEHGLRDHYWSNFDADNSLVIGIDTYISAQWVVYHFIVVQQKWLSCPKSAFPSRTPCLHQLCRNLAMTRT